MSGPRRAFVPRAQSTDKRFFGVVEAIVVDVIDPQKEGRIKLQFPWFDEDMVTEYCRVCQLYAGNGYGSFFVPEVGDEVLVAFVHGDMRMPIVLGGLYNGQDKPPSDRQKTKDQKMIRTKAGHELLLDDSTQDRRVRVRTAKDHVIDLDDQNRKVTVTSTAGHTMELDDVRQTVTVKTAAGQSVVLDGASGSVTVTGATITLDAASVQVGGAAATVKIGGAAAVLTPMIAEMFLPLFAAHTHMVGLVPTTPPVPAPPITPQVAGSSTVKVTL
jgi:phage baseplate assembly protein V